jgi:hypothetical protein
MNTILGNLQVAEASTRVVEALAAASACSLIRRLTQTPLQRHPERSRGISMKLP